MKKCNYLILLLPMLAIAGCSMLDHRDFSDEMEFSYDEPIFAPNHDFMVVAGDTGRDSRTTSEIRGRTPATARNAENYRHEQNLERELRYLESKLSPDEYEAHAEIRGQLGNISQQIYYLQLSSLDRQSYLRNRGIKSNYVRTSGLVPNNPSRNTYAARSIASANYPHINDIMLGMYKDDVMQNWGRPDKMEVAGDPRLENERWAYQRDGVTNYIYFESGRVGGWNRR